MKTRFFSLLLGILLPLFAVAQGGGAFSIAPADPNIESPQWLVYQLKPGDSMQDRVLVRNLSDTQMEYEIYPVDREERKSTDPPEAFALMSKDRVMSGIGRWVTLEKTHVTVAPRSQQVVGFSLAAPVDVSKQEYSGGIVVSPISSQQADASGSNIQVLTNVGLRVYLTVTDTPRQILRASQIAPKTDTVNTGPIWTPLNIVLGLVAFALLIYLLISLARSKKLSEKSEIG